MIFDIDDYKTEGEIRAYGRAWRTGMVVGSIIGFVCTLIPFAASAIIERIMR